MNLLHFLPQPFLFKMDAQTYWLDLTHLSKPQVGPGPSPGLVFPARQAALHT